MRLIRHLQRHTIAAAASVALLTAGLYPLVRQGLLGDMTPPGPPLASAVFFALGMTFLLFIPAGIFFDFVTGKNRKAAFLAPFILAALFALFWIFVEIAYSRMSMSFIPFYLTLGGLVGLAFCAYWLPLRFLNRKIPA
jgi:hypothetical protein